MNPKEHSSIRDVEPVAYNADLLDDERQAWRFKRKDYTIFALNRADAQRRFCPGLREIHTLIDIGFKRHQTRFEYDPINPNIILFPYLLDLQENDIIVNKTKDQIYTVDEVIVDDYDIFTGYAVITIEGDDSINIKAGDVLEVPESRLTRFLVSFPAGEVHEEAETELTPLKDGKFKAAITYRILKVEVGSQEPFSGIYKQLIHQFIQTEEDPEDFSYYFEVFAQAWDNLVQYIVWTTSNILSDILVENFEAFLIEFLPILIHNGVLMAHHAGRQDDRFSSRFKPNVATRNVTMYYRTQTSKVVRRRKLSDIILTPKIREGVE